MTKKDVLLSIIEKGKSKLKTAAKKYHTKYQKMIRRLHDLYTANHQQ